MTTIAFDGVQLAADSMITQDGTIFSTKMNKIFKLDIPHEDDLLLYGGFAGSVSQIHNFIKCIRCGIDLDEVVNEDLSAIIVGQKRVYLVEPGAESMYEWNDKVLAIGSGDVVAVSAMRLGFTAKEAVKHAVSMDIFSGGRIRSVEPRK